MYVKSEMSSSRVTRIQIDAVGGWTTSRVCRVDVILFVIFSAQGKENQRVE